MGERTSLGTLPPELNPALDRLAAEFEGSASREAVAEVLASSYVDIAKRATTFSFVPLLSERFARQQLQAIARVAADAAPTVPIVLFLCVHNAGRSQMALGWFNHLAGDRAIAWSGGSEPGAQVNPSAIAAMDEVGIDITTEFPKPWTDDIVRAADVVVTMGCGDTCPYFPGQRYEDWELDDPAGQDVAAVRPIRDEIERRVRALLESLGVAPR
jgi:arsenate reductase